MLSLKGLAEISNKLETILNPVFRTFRLNFDPMKARCLSAYTVYQTFSEMIYILNEMQFMKTKLNEKM